MTHRLLNALMGAAALAALAPAAHAITFNVANLASNGDVPAAHTDSNMVNPWGVSYAPTGPFWISDNATGLTSLKTSSGAKFAPLPQVAFQPSAASPTGQVFNAGLANGAFQTNGVTPLFLFDGEDGHISTWALANGGATQIGFASSNGAIFKGLAIANTGGDTNLYASDFHNGDIDVFTNTLSAPPTTAAVDPGIASGYAPFNVQVLGGKLYVTYALQDATAEDDVAGAGNGYVDVFNLDGSFDHRIASAGDTNLNSPWGLALAPSNWGIFAGKLLVGNFGDGTISVYDQITNAFLGKLNGTNGQPLVFTDLWALTPGNDHLAGLSRDIYFTAGLRDEGGGLFGRISVVPEPDAWLLLLAGFGILGATLRARAARHLKAA